MTEYNVQFYYYLAGYVSEEVVAAWSDAKKNLRLCPSISGTMEDEASVVEIFVFAQKNQP